MLSSTFSFLRPHSVSINFWKIKILCFGDNVLQMNTNKLLIALIYTKQSYMRALNNDSLLGWTAVSARQASSAPLCDSWYWELCGKNKMKLQRQLQQMKFKVLCASTLAIEESTTTKHLLQFLFIAFSNTELPCLWKLSAIGLTEYLFTMLESL